ncbi:MAG: hypothetical protein WAK17_12755, partial [Candidatus Nitrosopolaris sp.]
AYSIASPPHQKKHFELLIRWVRKPLPGRLTTELFNKKENDDVLWVKPVGVFTINYFLKAFSALWWAVRSEMINSMVEQVMML